MTSTSLPILDSPAKENSPAQGMLDPRTYDRALGCVHCGLCLPACPTYTQTHHEADSPRGRIQLMRGLADGVIDLTDSVKHHLDLCLDCRACETACPSGVVYHELIEETRAKLLEKRLVPSSASPLMRFLFFHVFTHPTRLKLLLLPARILQNLHLYPIISKLAGLLPPRWRKMEQMLPAHGPLWPASLPAVTSPRATGASPAPSRRIGFLPGCIGSVMFESVNRQAVELLAAGGAEVVVPPSQVCCGAIHHHNGDWEHARALARRNIDAFEGVDLIATTIAGCGAMLHEYDHLLRDDPQYAQRAKSFAAKVRDISQVLLDLPLPEPRFPINQNVTYHDACHLLHAQKVSAAPRKLLARIPGLRITPLPESDICCGAAGTYNLTQPQMAGDLAHRKLQNIAATGAKTCVTGNVGCAMHIQSQARSLGQPLRILHPVELLHRSIFGQSKSDPV